MVGINVVVVVVGAVLFSTVVVVGSVVVVSTTVVVPTATHTQNTGDYYTENTGKQSATFCGVHAT